MRIHKLARGLGAGGVVAALGLLVLTAGGAAAQTTTGTIRGTVTTDGKAVAGTEILAKNAATGVQRSTTTRTDGSYVIPGLQPATYEMTARRIGSAAQTRRVVVQIGAVQIQDFTLTAQAVQLQEISVTAAPVAETSTSEVGTNITPEQIAKLPTPSRNFLDLAALAPGVRVTADRINGTGKTFSAGALPAEQINVFIDGASYKNDIILGGVAGQDASRGNPFPRNAVQEFRIITNNFKAEYQKASSAIITAVTKSGTNVWQGSAFTELQNKSLVELDTFQRAAKVAKPDYSRYLVGLSAGGPVVKDKLFFFGSYEGNYQNRTALTVLGGNVSNYPAAVQALNNTTHGSPFREHLGFAKLSYVPDSKQSLDFEGDLRNESDTRGFGGQFGDSWRPYQSGENHRNNVYTGRARYTYNGRAWTNEALVSYQHYLWNQDPIDFTTPIQVSFGNYWLGGDDAAQALTQNRLSIRDDWTYTALAAHAIKLGANFDIGHYDLNKQLNENPKFVFNPDNSQYPVQAQYGFGNGDIKQHNNQFGIYAQDDWSLSRRVTVNAGVRWDVETGMFNRNYVTPQAERDSITAFANTLLLPIDPNRYFSNGSNRSVFLGAVQPRIGVSYALDDNSKTVLFGAFGIFYDRLYDNATIDETYRRQHPEYFINFTAPGTQPTANTTPWNPQYMSRAGLNALIAAIKPPQEVYLVPNDLKPPKSNQWSAGIRRDFGEFNGSVAYNGTRSYNGYSYEWANLKLNPATDDCCISGNVPAYQNVLLGNNSVHTWYNAMLLQINRPYRAKSPGHGWGAGISYTLSKAEAEGGDLFSFPQVTVGLNKRHPISDDRRHQFVLNGMLDLPWAWGVQASAIAQFSSGLPIQQLEFVPLPNPPGGNQRIRIGYTRSDWFKNVDLKLRKNFVNVGGNQLGLTGSVFNVLNTQNLGCFDETFLNPGSTPGSTVANPNYGHAGCTISDPRRFQIGLEYDFIGRVR
jgi:hypothetical protein